MPADSPATGPLAIAEAALRAPGVSDPRDYARRVVWLAIVHVLLLVFSVTAFVLLAWRGEFFITLAQRSNVETLTIAFFLVLFGYFSFVTAPGALGALRIAWYRLRLRTARDPSRIEDLRLRALGERHAGAAAAFDTAIELDGAPFEGWEIEMRDPVGSMGKLRFDGVRVQQLDCFRRGSNTLLGYVEHKIRELAKQDVSIVQWASTDEEDFLQYVATSNALRAVGKRLDAPTWPVVRITRETRDLLEREVSELCGALRDELFLPDWEFSGEHKLPIIPEPLGIISLSRNERRVDPLSSMTAALAVIVVVTGLICFFLARPPWIPGR